jgi:DNA-binding NarL/FixJ family response regulator
MPAPASQDRSLRVVLADDHDVVRKGLALLLESLFPFDVIEASTAEDAVQWGRDPATDLVLLDVRFPGHNGLWALAELRRHRPEVPVIMLSTFADDDSIQAALDAGANGFLLKEATTYQLQEAVDTALSRRGLYLHPNVAQRVLMRRRSEARYFDNLSDRELAVLRSVTEGATNEEIASRLHVSEKTVKSHLSSVFRKLEVTNRTQAAAVAIREKIVQTETPAYAV